MKTKIRIIFLLTSISLFSQTSEKKSFDEFLNENNNKIIYVDFWASWCKPCLKEIPKIRKLSKDYKNSEIIFVFFSIDENLDTWENLSKELNIKSYEFNFNSHQFKKPEIFKELKLSSLPRYLIIKNSIIIDENAKKPNKKIVEKLLK
ncbi:redoxin family protein [Winogradskyella psychrotolerans]|uniref:TlpA family protein disulfide reductase n=1 Tax=Winogradskyella psychrotolerans TaxID=1344585 RepID=UPI001C072682|nr:thioredoxin-like domain-containing protein [Winogradskyella psychrotolerans]MBU2922229.1 redoxin family protein [Winogradskyella psychrotolerans]